MGTEIRIKPHHFVDIVADYGFDRPSLTPHAYGHAVHIVTAHVIEDPKAELVIELGADDICLPCRHNVEGRCDDTIDITHRPAAPQSKLEYNLMVDRRWCEVTGLEQGSRLTVAEFCEVLRRSEGALEQIYREERPDYAVQKRVGLRRGIERILAAGGEDLTQR